MTPNSKAAFDAWWHAQGKRAVGLLKNPDREIESAMYAVAFEAWRHATETKQLLPSQRSAEERTEQPVGACVPGVEGSDNRSV